VPVTVLSRCQRFDLRRVEQPVLAAHFKKISANENASADDDALALIARAAEGSVRDGLSILDQAIAMGEGHVTALKVRDMLGLADRARIFDLAELLFKGDAASALAALASLHHDGAEATQIVSDLAEAVHIVARIKAVGEDPAGESLSVEEKRRGTALSAQLSMPYLSRAWQMLLKGIEETARAPNSLAAAEMVLIRIAYTADLPTPDDLIRTLGGGTMSARAPSGGAPRSEAPGESRGPLNAAPPPATAGLPVDDSALFDILDDDGEFGGLDEDVAIAAPPVGAMPHDVRSFDDVIALVGRKRDAKLKIHLEDHVSLVKFDATAGSIDIFLMPGAPPEIANELREKLNAWSGKRWVVVLSKSAGATPVGVVRREREAAELESLKAHPAVRAVLEAFPGAKIADVRRLIAPSATPDADDESATG